MKVGTVRAGGWYCPDCEAYYTWGDKMMACRGFVICSSINKRHRPHEVVYAPERPVEQDWVLPTCLIRVEIAA